jgi:gamma-glutamyltranspeptidase/glutathione hydrolase
MLSTLAERNSVESFYRGDIAHRIGEACQKNGGLLTAKDLAAYRARQVQPLQLSYNGFEIFSAPLTAGGLTTLEALSILKGLDWQPSGDPGPAAHARLEALRLAWKDRLERIGDPAFAKVPIKKLLSHDYARESAAKVCRAVKEKKPLTINIAQHHDAGTNNISSVDRHGNMCAITATHGNSFGAQVTVDGLGLTLGHGMSRFDPDPGHPNAPGPRKRPVMNVCPTVVLRNSKPVLAIGGAGGERIPNCLFDALTQYVVRGASMESAIAAPRLHNMGTLYVAVEPHNPSAVSQYLKDVGFNVQTWESTAIISAVSFNPANGECRGTIRGPAALKLSL